jgi:hypothetical protein
MAQQAGVKGKPRKLLDRAQCIRINRTASAHGQGKATGAVERVPDEKQFFFFLVKADAARRMAGRRNDLNPAETVYSFSAMAGNLNLRRFIMENKSLHKEKNRFE